MRTFAGLVMGLLTALGSCTQPRPGGGDEAGPRDSDGDDFEAADDCDDADASVFPGAPDTPYDGIDQDCDGADLVDGDGDGWAATEAGGTDCDDADATVNPQADEVAYDGVDDDCSGGDVTDVDGDGYDAVEAGGEDCGDRDSDVHPGVRDDCGRGDEDCDGTDDEDQDGDGDGQTSCAGDCDDADPYTNEDAYDVAGDGIDQNCNGVDKGNCGDAVYQMTEGLYVGVYATDCEDAATLSFSVSYGSERMARWLPEDASCAGNTVTWDASYQIDACFTAGADVDIGGSFSLNLSTGCGTWSGSGSSCQGVYCDDAEGAIGFTQGCG